MFNKTLNSLYPALNLISSYQLLNMSMSFKFMAGHPIVLLVNIVQKQSLTLVLEALLHIKGKSCWGSLAIISHTVHSLPLTAVTQNYLLLQWSLTSLSALPLCPLLSSHPSSFEYLASSRHISLFTTHKYHILYPKFKTPLDPYVSS